MSEAAAIIVFCMKLGLWIIPIISFIFEILIVVDIITLLKVSKTGNEEEKQKKKNSLIKKIIIVVILFFISVAFTLISSGIKRNQRNIWEEERKNNVSDIFEL